MATHSSILAWEIQWTEDPGGLQSLVSQRVRLDLAAEHACISTYTTTKEMIGVESLWREM